MNVWKTYLLLMFVSGLLYGCGLMTSSSDQAGSKSTYIRHDQQDHGVIVFVHGVIGDSVETWTSVNKKAYWPRLISADLDFDGYDVYVYEYPSPLFRKSFNIDEVSENMRLLFDADGVTRHDEIIFIAHSMGGLVVRSYLLKYRDVADRVKFIYFYSTPTEGAQISSLGAVLSNNSQFDRMVSFDADQYLADQMRSWQAAKFSIKSYCAYEKRPTFGITIVNMRSAAALCSEPIDPIDANHIDIVKPENERSVSYLAFKQAFQESSGSDKIDNLNRVYSANGPFHLGDEVEMAGWPPLYGDGKCFDAQFYLEHEPKGLVLRLESYGAESNNQIVLNGHHVAVLPPQSINRYHATRPNEWSETREIKLPGTRTVEGMNKLEICVTGNPKPEFPDDDDDLQIRNIGIFIE